jgi:hypothetical protein
VFDPLLRLGESGRQPVEEYSADVLKRAARLFVAPIEWPPAPGVMIYLHIGVFGGSTGGPKGGPEGATRLSSGAPRAPDRAGSGLSRARGRAASRGRRRSPATDWRRLPPREIAVPPRARGGGRRVLVRRPRSPVEGVLGGRGLRRATSKLLSIAKRAAKRHDVDSLTGSLSALLAVHYRLGREKEGWMLVERLAAEGIGEGAAKFERDLPLPRRRRLRPLARLLPGTVANTAPTGSNTDTTSRPVTGGHVRDQHAQMLGLTLAHWLLQVVCNRSSRSKTGPHDAAGVQVLGWTQSSSDPGRTISSGSDTWPAWRVI